MKLGTQAHREALDTDNAWQAELEKAFGKRAGDMRYVKAGHGEPGTALRASLRSAYSCARSLAYRIGRGA